MNALWDYERLLTFNEAAEVLNVGTKTLNTWGKQGLIGYYAFGKQKYFSYGHVSACMVDLLQVPVLRFREEARP